jgi:hypothetical protein
MYCPGHEAGSQLQVLFSGYAMVCCLVNLVQKIILSARQAPGRGSAAAPADFLRSVLSEEGSTQLGK